jgi:SAM-dependent methyltransferase
MNLAQQYLKNELDKEILLYYFDNKDYPQDLYQRLLVRWGDDSVFSEEHRFVLLNILIPNLKDKKILDMAAGCGSFVIQGLRAGYNLKFQENDYPKEWRERLPQAVGEKLPFEDNTFDIFDSWQTIEHVTDERDCIFELYRVLKKGGMGILRGPDYICFFEGHYRMFWFPLMGDGKLARLYLKLRGRPFGGLKTFHPVNPFKTKRYAREAGFKIVNIKRKQIYDAAKRRIPMLAHPLFKPVLFGIYFMWDMYRGIKYFGTGEATISFLLIKE